MDDFLFIHNSSFSIHNCGFAALRIANELEKKFLYVSFINIFSDILGNDPLVFSQCG